MAKYFLWFIVFACIPGCGFLPNSLSAGPSSKTSPDISVPAATSSDVISIEKGGTAATTASGARTNLGLGSAAILNVGSAANNVVQLDSNARLPALDGTHLTNVEASSVGGVSATDIAAGANAASAATDQDVAGTLVKRDNSGNFIGNVITAVTKFIGNITGNVTGNADTATSAKNVTGTVAVANGGTGATTASGARTNLGLGSAATLDAGTTANNMIQLDSNARLPAVDGSQLTNVTATSVTGTVAVVNGGTGATTAGAARINLGLGSSATLNTGTAANNVVQLDSSARLPGVDGSQLSNLKSSITGEARRLIVTNKSTDNADPNTTLKITFSELVLKDSAGGALIASNGDVDVNIQTSGANGVDAGSAQNSNWYYYWVISDGLAVAAIFSLSSTSPLMPGAYSYRALVGAVYRDANGKFYQFYQVGRTVRYKAGLNAVNQVGATSPTALSLSSWVPPIATTVQTITYCAPNGGANYSGTCNLNFDGSTGSFLTGAFAYYLYYPASDYVAQYFSGELPLMYTQKIWYFVSQANGYISLNVTGFSFE